MPPDLIDWLRLRHIPGLGPVLLRRFLDRFKTPAALLSADENDLKSVPGLGPRLLRQLRNPPSAASVQKEYDQLHHLNAHVITWNSPHYPRHLTTIYDPPPLLFALGEIRHLNNSMLIALVGTRSASQEGLKTAQHLARDLAHQGVASVSGLAVGIDAAAHQGTLDAGLPTIAVTATGFDVDYPRPNRALRERIIQQGCIVTEAVPGTQPTPKLFPPRNRIISGLSQGVVVVEAPRRSGALITARLALEQNREVFAVPGSISDLRSRGSHHLLKQGASLVENADDVLDCFSWQRHKATPNRTCGESPTPPTMKVEKHDFHGKPHAVAIPDKETSDPLLTQLQNGPINGDELARATDLTTHQLTLRLLKLELAGLIERRPGNIYAQRNQS